MQPDARPVRAPHRQSLFNAVRLTGLDPGRFAAAIAVTDRLLLPKAARIDGDGSPVTLERGREIVRRVRFTAPAGSLDVSSDAPAVRLLDAGGATVALLRVAVERRVPRRPAAPGNYLAEACRDAACAVTGARLGEVTIVAGAVARVP